jgi:hypothetical protein
MDPSLSKVTPSQSSRTFLGLFEDGGQQDRPIPPEFVVTSSVTRGSVQTIIDICQRKLPLFDKSQTLKMAQKRI